MRPETRMNVPTVRECAAIYQVMSARLDVPNVAPMVVNGASAWPMAACVIRWETATTPMKAISRSKGILGGS